VAVDSGLIGGASAPFSLTGSGNLHYVVEAGAALIAGLFENPSRYYLDIHTAAQPTGGVRGQLRTTDEVRWPLVLGLSSAGTLTLRTIRDGVGAVVAALAIFDMNHSLAAGTEIAGLGITPELSVPFRTESGAGNLYAPVTVSTAAGLAAVEAILANPDRHSLTMNTKWFTLRASIAPLMDKRSCPQWSRRLRTWL
jgi:hypothetical protein